MNKFPPRPPRYPPGLFSWSSIEHYVLTLCVLVVDFVGGVSVARSGASDFVLAAFTFASLVAGWSCWRTIWRTVETLRTWRDLRRDYDELLARYEREQRK